MISMIFFSKQIRPKPILKISLVMSVKVLIAYTTLKQILAPNLNLHPNLNPSVW